MSVEYYISRIAVSKPAIDRELFCISKFEGTDEPTQIYWVTWNKSKDEMSCSCPNRRRGKGIDDKHGGLVRRWLLEGEPTTAMTIPSL